MSYRTNNTTNNDIIKNDVVQTIPERDIVLCTLPNHYNSNTITSNNSNNNSINVNKATQNYLITTTHQLTPTLISSHITGTMSSTPTSVMTASSTSIPANNGNLIENNSLEYHQIINSNFNKMNLNSNNSNNNANYYNHHNYRNYVQPSSETYLQSTNINYEYDANNGIKHYMPSNVNAMVSAIQPYNRHSFDERYELNYMNNSANVNTVNDFNSITNNITIERLQARIMLLEQQINNSNTKNAHKPASLMDLRLKEIEGAAADLRADIEKQSAKDFKISKLEELLCKREYEIEELLKKSNKEKVETDQEFSKFKMNFQKKEEELIDLRTKLASLQKDFETKVAKNRELELYINTLPTMDEYDEVKKTANDMKSENEKIKNQVTEYEKKIYRAKLFIKEKQNEIKDYEEKLKQKDLEKEKLENEYDKFRELNKSVDQLVDLRKDHAKVNAELDAARKLLNAHNDQLNVLNTKHQDELNKLREQIRLENELTIALRDEVESKEKVINDLTANLKEISTYNQCLISTNLDLTSKITSYETVMNNDYQKLLKILCKEIEICKNKLNTLVKNCICIYEGKEFNVGSLIYDVGTNYVNFEQNDQLLTGVLTPDYLRQTINDLQELKSKIDELRLAVSAKFAEKLGSEQDACCIM